MDAYGELARERRHDKGSGIVIVSAESLDIIRRTHGHYLAPPGAQRSDSPRSWPDYVERSALPYYVRPSCLAGQLYTATPM